MCGPGSACGRWIRNGGAPPGERQSPGEAYDAVLESAGAFPRDAMTAETIDDVRNRTGDWEPDPPADLLQGLTPGVPPTDGDKDRIVDEWEGAHRLDATDPDDHATVMSSGYTAIEEYVNELSVALVGAPPPASQTPVRTGASDTKTTAAGGDNGSDPLAGIALALSIVALVLAGFAVHRVRGGRPPQAPQA